MKIIPGVPLTEAEEKMLAIQVAALHARLVFDYMKQQGYTSEEKLEILAALKQHKKGALPAKIQPQEDSL